MNSPGRPSHLRNSLLGRVVPAVMVTVALLQHARATTVHQSSWSGAGFGMFATYESELSRFMRVFLADGNGPRVVELPAPLSRQAFEASVVPTHERLAALAQRVRSMLEVPRTTTVRVEVWGISYHASRITPRLLASAEEGA